MERDGEITRSTGVVSGTGPAHSLFLILCVCVCVCSSFLGKETLTGGLVSSNELLKSRRT